MDLHLLDARPAGHLDVEGVQQLAVLLLQLLGLHLALGDLGEGGGARRDEADLGLGREVGRDFALDRRGRERGCHDEEGCQKGETELFHDGFPFVEGLVRCGPEAGRLNTGAV